MVITSLQNTKIKSTMKLREARERKKHNRIIIEGKREIDLARQAGVEIETLFLVPELNKDSDVLSGDLKKVALEIDRSIFSKISYRENPDGLLAVAIPRFLTLADLKLRPDPLIIVLESIEKPGNLGAVARSADAAQADAILIADPKTDIYSPYAIRASQGTIFTNQIVADSNEKIFTWLQRKKIRIFTTTPAADKSYTDADLTGAAAIIAGTEDKGLSPFWMNAGDEKIKIPMNGIIDSLNVSTSTAIIIFEAIRQRNNE